MINGGKYNLLFKVKSAQFLFSMNELSSNQLTYDYIAGTVVFSSENL